jgi:methylmalonyl-CoA mutase
VRIFGGGGGVIVPAEIRALEAGTVDRIYSPEDGRRTGLQGIIDDLLSRCDFDTVERAPRGLDALLSGDAGALARWITVAEQDVATPGTWADRDREAVARAAEASKAAVIGLTGTGGAGKSSVTDELLRRWRLDAPQDRIAVLSIDPTRRKSGGALLGDRIRMNALHPDRVFFRSLATRDQKGELSGAIRSAVQLCTAAGCDVVFVETSGIGQGDSDITRLADLSAYVMTPEYGAPSQLEKIDMLELADFVVINKLDRRGGLDAVRDVRRQVRRNRLAWEAPEERLPVYGTVASRFADKGMDAFYVDLRDALAKREGRAAVSRLPTPSSRVSDRAAAIIPSGRERYLDEIAVAVRSYHEAGRAAVAAVRRVAALETARVEVAGTAAEPVVAERLAAARGLVPREAAAMVEAWPSMRAAYAEDELVYDVRGRPVRQPLVTTSLSGTRIARVVLPDTDEPGAVVSWRYKEGPPGTFPYTAGVFPLKREGEDPKRMFAGEGGPAQTNARFHFLCKGENAHRLSTAFDSVTLYGEDPDERPDIWGKVGVSGVSVPTLDDMKILYSGFDLNAPTTSVSMTINGPAPILLAMFFHTAIDQARDALKAKLGRDLTPEEAASSRASTLRHVRGTVQADILKEDQAQNTCIFSTEFALRMMGDVAAWFVEHDVRNFYAVSISGYHIAEAGANPISQLAFTLANGFTYVEAWRARGIPVDAFAPNLSFFFSNGLDPEYTVIGRVARRIWAVAMRDRYGANERSQKLKYHVQTSGRSLHAREIQFNDIRTTLQALLALLDHCNSLHTNAYDEAITTPTEESVRRAMAIQLIIQQELGLARNEAIWPGSHFVERLTDLVEEAVLQEFERLGERGGVLGAMELQYQRSRIQEESLLYEHRKHDGSLPIVGINTFLDPATLDPSWTQPEVELRRSSDDDKRAQIESVRRFQAAHAHESGDALRRLQDVALAGGNLFGALMEAVPVASLGQISAALYAVGGAYRRNL